MRSAFSRKVLIDSLVRLSPTSLLKNLVMLIVEITFFIVVAMAIVPQAFGPVASVGERVFYIEVAAILLITVWFSTFSDALAEQQAKSTAGALRKLETEVSNYRLIASGIHARVGCPKNRRGVPSPAKAVPVAREAPTVTSIPSRFPP